MVLIAASTAVEIANVSAGAIVAVPAPAVAVAPLLLM